MLLLSAVARLFVSLLVVTPVVRFGVPLGPKGDTVADERALAVGLAAGLAWPIVAFLVGPIPVLGGVASLAAWSALVYALTPADVRTSVGLAFVSWTLSVALLHGFVLAPTC